MRLHKISSREGDVPLPERAANADIVWPWAVEVKDKTLEAAQALSALHSLPDEQKLEQWTDYQVEKALAQKQARSLLAAIKPGHVLPPEQAPVFPKFGYGGGGGPSRSAKFGYFVFAYKNLRAVPPGVPRMTRTSLWVFALDSDGKRPIKVVYLGSLLREEPDNVVSPEIGGVTFTPAENGLTYYRNKKLYVIALPAL